MFKISFAGSNDLQKFFFEILQRLLKNYYFRSENYNIKKKLKQNKMCGFTSHTFDLLTIRPFSVKGL